MKIEKCCGQEPSTLEQQLHSSFGFVFSITCGHCGRGIRGLVEDKDKLIAEWNRKVIYARGEFVQRQVKIISGSGDIAEFHINQFICEHPESKLSPLGTGVLIEYDAEREPKTSTPYAYGFRPEGVSVFTHGIPGEWLGFRASHPKIKALDAYGDTVKEATETFVDAALEKLAWYQSEPLYRQTIGICPTCKGEGGWRKTEISLWENCPICDGSGSCTRYEEVK